MPIKPIVLQRRHAELGRIRLGHKTGEGRGRPAKLGTFRFTSPSQGYITDLAALYGGTPQPWDNNGVAGFEVFTTAKTIPVIAVKGGMSQWLETWSGGGCTHRCDGEMNALTGEPCNLDDPAHVNAKPTTRLSVMLPELDAIGVWRLESHGWNAAAELPTVAELAAYVGDMVPAELHLVERRAVKDGKTSRFVVPVLDLRIGVHRLREIAEAVAGGLELQAAASAPVAAIEGPTPAPAAESVEDPFQVYFELLPRVESLAELAEMWDAMKAKNLVGTNAPATTRASDFFDAWRTRAHQLKAEDDAAPAAAAQPDAEGVYDAVVVDEPAGDPEEIWQQIVAAAGDRGMGLADLQDDFSARMGGVTAADASAGEMRHYLALLTAGSAA